MKLFNIIVLIVLLIHVFSNHHVACTSIKSKYIAYKDGEPIHIQDPQDVPPATCNKICLHFAHLTKDCDCECEGLWTGKVCEKCSLRASDCRHGSCYGICSWQRTICKWRYISKTK